MDLFSFFWIHALSAQNGVFQAPSLDAFQELSEAEHKEFLDASSILQSANFTEPSGFSMSSFYSRPEGLKELKEVARTYIKISSFYSRVIFIGRSGSGILAFLRGVSLSGAGSADFIDLPFSYPRKTSPSDAERQALRRHLIRNGLDPHSIARSAKPILLSDFVFSGAGANRLTSEISLWAKELHLSKEVREKLHFLGLYPAHLLAREHLWGINRSSARELGGQASAPTDEEIKSAADRWQLPRKTDFERDVSRVISFRISTEFYVYASIRGPQAQKSFTPDLWDKDFDRTEFNPFRSQQNNRAFIELHFLMSEGERYGKGLLLCEAFMSSLVRLGPSVVKKEFGRALYLPD